MTDKALGWTLRIGGVAGVVLILWLIQVMLPDFYSTMWWLMIRGDLDGLTDYIASFGYAAIGVSVFMIAFVNAIGIPSIPFLTVNGIIFGLVPGILISWVGEVIGIEISFRLTRTLLRNQAKRSFAGAICWKSSIPTAASGRLWSAGRFPIRLMWSSRPSVP